MEVRDRLAADGIDVPLMHAANSPGALTYPESRLDFVRTGLAVYGLRPTPGMAPDVELRPAMRVVSEVSAVRRLPAGARPAYGRTRPLPADAWVATVPIGYADGVPRRLGQVGGAVLIGGKARPFAGTVTMDQLVIDCGDDEVAVGDEVVLIGEQDAAAITVDDWAEPSTRSTTRSCATLGLGCRGAMAAGVPEPDSTLPAEPGRGNDTLTAVPGVAVGHWTDASGADGRHRDHVSRAECGCRRRARRRPRHP